MRVNQRRGKRVRDAVGCEEVGAGESSRPGIGAVWKEPTIMESVKEEPCPVGVSEAVGRSVGERARPAHWDRVLAGLRSLLGPLSEAAAADLLGRVERVRVSRGEAVVAQGEESDAVYLLISGRMRAVREGAEVPVVVGEIDVGESVGEMGFFTREPRSATVYAIRESELLRFPNDEFDALLREHPGAAREVTRVVVNRLRRQYGAPVSSPPREIALVGITPGLDLRSFADRLGRAMERHGSVRSLTREAADRAIGRDGEGDASAGSGVPGAPAGLPDETAEVALLRWLGEQESAADHVLYVSDGGDTAWSRRCVERADRVVLVADAGGDPVPGRVERSLIRLGPSVSAPHVTLALVHPADTELPTGTAAWLDARNVDTHYHLRGFGDGELARLARHLTGRSVGVVLGGGGARGWAHIGALRALHEAGVPVDRIGGTSMGAIVAAAHALGKSHREIIESARTAWLAVAPHKEYTLPVFSLLRGRRVAHSVGMVFRDIQVEDLWIPYYSISTNISKAEMRVHRRGDVARAVTASATLPGVLTPVVDGGDLLVDGGVLNNLPVDVMRDAEPGRVIAIDVSGVQQLQYEGEAFPSPWQFLRDRLLRRPPATAPRLGEVLVRCTTLGSAHRLNSAIEAADLYLQPPVRDISLMDFEALDRAVELGYVHARDRVLEWWETQIAAAPAPG